MIEKIFYGRNGMDTLSLFILLVSLPFLMFRWANIIGFILLLYVVFRCFSKNIEKRRAEEWKFRQILTSVVMFFKKNTLPIRKFFSYQILKFKNRKTTVYFKCPNCKAILSLPRHKGKLKVTCTVCRHECIKQTGKKQK